MLPAVEKPDIEQEFEATESALAPELASQLALRKLIGSLSAMLALGLTVALVRVETVRTLGGILLVLVVLPVVLLRIVDLGCALRDLPYRQRLLRGIGLLLGLPEALLGVASMLVGLTIVLWVLYNSFIERLPTFTGHGMGFGVGPFMITGGWLWTRRAFARNAGRDSEDTTRS